MNIQGKVAVVTGAAGGIGSSIAHRIAQEKAIIVAVDINYAGIQNLINKIKAADDKAYGIETDITSSEQVNKMVNQVLNQYGKIDILVNCAGGSARERASLFHRSVEDVWDYVINLNLKGTMICCRAVINHMLESRSGVILNIASISGVYGAPLHTDYSAAKGGIIAFTRALSKEVAPYGVRVNSVSPGGTLTPALSHLSKETLEELGRVPLGRMGKPEDIASLVTFLVSDEASWISGENYIISGGK